MSFLSCVKLVSNSQRIFLILSFVHARARDKSYLIDNFYKTHILYFIKLIQTIFIKLRIPTLYKCTFHKWTWKILKEEMSSRIIHHVIHIAASFSIHYSLFMVTFCFCTATVTTETLLCDLHDPVFHERVCDLIW